MLKVRAAAELASLLGHAAHGQAYVCRAANTDELPLLHAVRVIDCDGSGSIAQIIAGLEWISGNAELPAVVLMSIGGTATAVLDTAVQALTNQGITVVVAAGNSAEGQASETNCAPCGAPCSCPFSMAQPVAAGNAAS